MFLWSALPERTLALTFHDSLSGAFFSVTISAQTLKVAETVIVPWDDVIYFCGPLATALTSMRVSDENSLSETEPVPWKSRLASTSLPVTRIFQTVTPITQTCEDKFASTKSYVSSD
jgi:hypothetical protein